MDISFIQNNLGWFIILVIWEFIWKGMALWRAARLGQKGWYLILLFINTAGILSIIYLLTHRDTKVVK